MRRPEELEWASVMSSPPLTPLMQWLTYAQEKGHVAAKDQCSNGNDGPERKTRVVLEERRDESGIEERDMRRQMHELEPGNRASRRFTRKPKANIKASSVPISPMYSAEAVPDIRRGSLGVSKDLSRIMVS